MGKLNELALIGEALKEERRLLGMTQAQAARQFKISLKALRNLEQGYGGVTLATASQILEYMGKQLRVGDIIASPANQPMKRPRRKQILETLELVKPVLQKKFSVDKIALFGSCARDEATKNSDIDLAIHFSKPPTFSSLGRLTVFLEALFDGRKTDIVEFKKMIPEVATKAKRDFIYV
ncbi:MAG: XRE family transcriptional regulator [Bdellovibrionaceae bacterium]|nr:XRE family transcriptional regulator [Pseudobdellovibrionaceae bacterium]MBX3035180.1 XRE family transcriptional regulator [Pseudobdellovibrionaceae bacterium]